MHFFKSSETLDVQVCQFIFDATMMVFEFVLAQEKSHKLSTYCPQFIVFAVTMGVSLMLRILKGPWLEYVDHERGSALFPTVFSFLKSVSIEQGDKPSKIGTIAEQMWSSKRMFKDADGNFDVDLRVKNKLSTALIHDIGVRWREEFVNLERFSGLPQVAGMFLTVNCGFIIIKTLTISESSSFTDKYCWLLASCHSQRWR
jgi:hypothetical protein